MSLEIFATLILFAFVTSVTPGPNNLMLLASGVNYGFRRSLPHMFGITVGFLILLLCVGFGVGAAIDRVPALRMGLKIVGGAYLVYLAWRIAAARSIDNGSGAAEGAGRPLRFIQAAAFQWVNPKAWVIALGAMAAYTDPNRYVLTVLIVGLASAAVNFPSIAVWAGFGAAMHTWLADPVRLKWFNLGMATCLVLSLWPMLR